MKNICAKRQFDKDEACKLVLEMDQKREAWVQHLVGRSVYMSFYDVTFNKLSFDEGIIVNAVINLLVERKIIEESVLKKMKS